MSDFLTRLEKFLDSRGEPKDIQQLTPDASTREYFRVGWSPTSTAIICVYPEPFSVSEQSYIDVTGLFLASGLPVAKILDVDGELGLIVIEDFGDRILRDELLASEPLEREELIERAVDLIPRIQAATGVAFERGSIASKLKFDVEKLTWELEFFKTHYFTTLINAPLNKNDDEKLSQEFLELSTELDSRAQVLCHRDFHAANLMVAPDSDLRIIDHQDARIGTVSYDLVSLLLDRVTEAPSPSWLAAKRTRFLAGRDSLNLPGLDPVDFELEFRLQTIQRCLKAVGTFSFQSATRGKSYFIPFIRPMFDIVLRAARQTARFPIIETILLKELGREFPN